MAKYSAYREPYIWSWDSKEFLRSFFWVLAVIAAWHHVGVLVFLFICLAEVRVKFK